MPNELDPQAEAFLAQLRSHPAAQALSADLSSEQGRTALRQMARSSSGPPSEPMSSITDIIIPGGAGNIPVRSYVPSVDAASTDPMPVLVYCHGGGFVAGDLDGYDAVLRALANRAGCIIVSVAYRLAPENPYPAANDDAWAALIWVAYHGADIGADPRRLAIGGDSAGGLLAAWVAQKAKRQRLPLRLQVLLYPNLDATTSSRSWQELGTGAYIVSHKRMMAWYDAYLPQGVDRKSPEVSPLFAPDLAGVAPAFIVTADHDPLRDEGNAYAARLKGANVPVQHTCWPGMIHGFLSMAGVLDAGKALIDQTGAALREAFA